MQKTIYFLSFIIGISISTFAQSGYNININIEGYQNDTLIIGYYYGKSQRVFDTLYAIDKGVFSMVGNDTLPQGVYLGLVKPDHNYFQFMVDDDTEFDIETSILSLFGVKFKGSVENERFSNYLMFLKTKNKESAKIHDEFKSKTTTVDSILKNNLLEKLNIEVKTEQNRIITENPLGLTSILIKSELGIEFPIFKGSTEEKQLAKYQYYRKHYFDHFDLSNDINLYTPGFDKKVIAYLDKWTPNYPDTLIQVIDDLLTRMEKAENTYKYYLSTFINKYGRSKIVGQDAIYVFLANNYYASGKAYWADKSTIKKITKEARLMEGSLIGKKAANVKLYREDSTSLMLHDIKSKYTILLFWSPTCGHCKKSMPKVVKFQKKYADKGVKLVAICTKHMKDYNSCWEAIKKENMENFLNLGDKEHRSRFKLKFNVRQTPKIFILDESKDIIFKDIPPERLEEVMENIMK